jgi:hypothetical protein
MAVDEIVQVDSLYQVCADRLDLKVSADDERTLFERVSKSGRFEFQAYVPHNVSSAETSIWIRYNQNKDARKLSNQANGLKTLEGIQELLTMRYGKGVSSDFTDAPEVNCVVRLKSHAEVIPYVQIASSLVPK